jgi:hypothetical protein
VDRARRGDSRGARPGTDRSGGPRPYITHLQQRLATVEEEMIVDAQDPHLAEITEVRRRVVLNVARVVGTLWRLSRRCGR